MSDALDVGVVLTEYAAAGARSPVASLWSYESARRGPHRRPVDANADGSHTYWLERFDPLLNTILPSTHVSIVVNVGDGWASGRSLASAELLPRCCVVGPVTEPRIFRVGRSVRACGVVFAPTLSTLILGAPAFDLVDRIVPLADLWPANVVARMIEQSLHVDIRRAAGALERSVIDRLPPPRSAMTIPAAAARTIDRHAGRVSIHAMASDYGLSRHRFARSFVAEAGLSPKLYARIVRFQRLVHVLLSTDVARWATTAMDLGYYDQAHMINEFRSFTGSSPTSFFQPHGEDAVHATVQIRGRPSEWVQRAQ